MAGKAALIRKYTAYSDYKDSGFSWLGKIPRHWDVSPLKWQIERVDGGAWGGEPKGLEDTIVLRSTEQAADGQWEIDDPAPRNLSSHEVATTLLEKDDLLMTKSSGSSLHIGKTSIVTEEVASLRCGYSNFMQRIRIRSEYSAKFYWYVFNNERQLVILSINVMFIRQYLGVMLFFIFFISFKDFKDFKVTYYKKIILTKTHSVLKNK